MHVLDDLHAADAPVMELNISKDGKIITGRSAGS
jgi:hypothetical protein